ncbi:30S ribosomal protein S17e [Candidatus Woesearchaeota archaeon]|jgi:small subunit ribosomal protein S17e|nr:30S ribosomal protein S17e [Candidatus Woesearchaeota archaeon]
MGRIKTTMIKRVGNKLVKTHRDKFSPIFEKNKEILPQFVDVPSKKLRNVLAGYIARLMQVEE